MRVLLLCLVILGVRLATLGMYPLADRTESRYGEIARVMATTGDVVTPRLTDRSPFWGKPPLSTWAQAVGIQLLGRNEFAVRLPAWIVVFLTGLLTWLIARTVAGAMHAWIAAAIFVCTPMVLAMAGCAMTDPYLTFGTTLSLYALVAWCSGRARTPRWTWGIGLLFGVGVAVGTLSKGPIAIVLAGAPLVVLLTTPSGRRRLRGWPWLRAITACACLTVPWFVVAESRTPGFLQYFIVGEHWLRFTDGSWTDLYGKPHTRMLGTVWVFFALAFLPWIPNVVRSLRGLRRSSIMMPTATLVLVASALAPLLLFSFARSLLLPYVYPAIPAACVLLCRSVRPRDATRALRFVATLSIIAAVLLPFVPDKTWAHVSHRPLVEGLRCECVVYCRRIKNAYSAQFYSDGIAVSAHDLDAQAWQRIRASLPSTCFVTKHDHFTGLPADIRSQLVLVRSFEPFKLWKAATP